MTSLSTSLRSTERVALNASKRRVLSVPQTRRLMTRPPPAYPGHIPLSMPEKAFMAVGSGLMALLDPRRADMVAAAGETTIGPVLPRLRDHMLDIPEGRRILKERPRINSNTVDLAALARLPENTLGRTYVTWLEKAEVTPDSREPVHYIDDPELAYVMQRYRESHDFYHAINGMPVSVEYELAVKAFEFANLGLPMAALAMGAIWRLGPKRRARLLNDYLPWAVRCGSSARSMITVYWEERWEQDMGELKRELGLFDPPTPPKWKVKKPEANPIAMPA